MPVERSLAPPLLVVITGPSGVGKDTVLARLGDAVGKERGSYHLAVTATTRPRRPNERDGVDYHFLSPQEFEALLASDGLLENAVVYGHRYGVPKDQVRQALARGADVILRTDVQGASYLKSAYPQAVTIFLMPPTWPELERRLRSRATDDPQVIERRLEEARREMDAAFQFDHVVTNDDLERCVAAIVAIIDLERAKPGRQRPPV